MDINSVLSLEEFKKMKYVELYSEFCPECLDHDDDDWSPRKYDDFSPIEYASVLRRIDIDMWGYIASSDDDRKGRFCHYCRKPIELCKKKQKHILGKWHFVSTRAAYKIYLIWSNFVNNAISVDNCDSITDPTFAYSHTLSAEQLGGEDDSNYFPFHDKDEMLEGSYVKEYFKLHNTSSAIAIAEDYGFGELDDLLEDPSLYYAAEDYDDIDETKTYELIISSSTNQFKLKEVIDGKVSRPRISVADILDKAKTIILYEDTFTSTLFTKLDEKTWLKKSYVKGEEEEDETLDYYQLGDFLCVAFNIGIDLVINDDETDSDGVYMRVIF